MTFKEFFKKNTTKIKYGLVFLFFIMMIFSIERYMNYLEIINTTENIKKKSELLQEELDFVNNFESKYLASDYGHFFLAHDNNVIFWGERIIAFKDDFVQTGINDTTLSHIKTNEEKIIEMQDNKELPPQEAWEKFFQEKILQSQ
jgi:hypothetical protein